MNRALPNDMTRCFGIDCDLKKQCCHYLTMAIDHQNDLERRAFTPRPQMGNLSNPHTGQCDYFIEDR